METEGKQSKNNLMLVKTWQGERGEKMSRDLKQKTAQKASAMHSSMAEETFVFAQCW